MHVAEKSGSHGRGVANHLRVEHLPGSARCKAQWPLCQLSKHRPRSRQMTNGAGLAGSKKATGADGIGLLVGPLKIGLRAGPIRAAVAVRAAAAAHNGSGNGNEDGICVWNLLETSGNADPLRICEKDEQASETEAHMVKRMRAGDRPESDD